MADLNLIAEIEGLKQWCLQANVMTKKRRNLAHVSPADWDWGLQTEFRKKSLVIQAKIDRALSDSGQKLNVTNPITVLSLTV